MAHDFKNYPELTNGQMPIYYFDSPHKQIVDNFEAKVIKVTDGDTIRVTTDFRDFSFPIRMIDIAAPELNEKGGIESQRWLEREILGETVDILVNKNNRVGKWGRLLGAILFRGFNYNDLSMREGFSIRFEDRKRSSLPDFNKALDAGVIK